MIITLGNIAAQDKPVITMIRHVGDGRTVDRVGEM
jgi:hypothetical protein